MFFVLGRIQNPKNPPFPSWMSLSDDEVHQMNWITVGTAINSIVTSIVDDLVWTQIYICEKIICLHRFSSLSRPSEIETHTHQHLFVHVQMLEEYQILASSLLNYPFLDDVMMQAKACRTVHFLCKNYVETFRQKNAERCIHYSWLHQLYRMCIDIASNLVHFLKSIVEFFSDVLLRNWIFRIFGISGISGIFFVLLGFYGFFSYSDGCKIPKIRRFPLGHGCLQTKFPSVKAFIDNRPQQLFL